MTYNTGAAARSRFSPTAADAENVDRILLAACAAIWLAALGSAVAATVALIDLGSKHQESTSESGTPWLLYGVIAVSALVIIGAIPLLIRARRTALEDPRGGYSGGGARPVTARTQTAVRGADPRTQNIRTVQQPSAGGRRPGSPQSAPKISTYDAGLPPAVERLWLRCSVVMASAMGLALLAIGIATYLMAAGHDTFAWAAYVIAGLITLAMPPITLVFLRQLREYTDTP